MNHRKIMELLPWYTNATLSGEERAEVETHLAECHECARELESLRAVQKVVVEMRDEQPAPSPLQINRALAEIEEYEQTRPGPAKGQSAEIGSLWSRIASFWAGWWRPTPMFARSALAVQMALVLALGATVIYRQYHPVKEYIVQSGGSGEAKGVTFSVSFNENASEQEIRQTVLGIHGSLESGPSLQNLYTIRVSSLSPENAVEIENVLQRLRQNQHVVRLALQKQ